MSRTTPFRLRQTIDSRADPSAVTGLINSWHGHHGGTDLQATRQTRHVVQSSCKITNHGTTLVDSTLRDIELFLGNGTSDGQPKRIALTSSSHTASSHKILLHTHRGSCYITKTTDLMFTRDAWDAVDGTNLCWFTTRQSGGKLVGVGVVSPYEPTADPFHKLVNAIMEQKKVMPRRRQIGQGTSVAMSADGNTVLVGACNDDYHHGGAIGACWVYVRTPQALHSDLVQSIARGQGSSASTPAEARAFNRLYQSQQLVPSPEDIPLGETLMDKHLPISGGQWLQVGKLVGTGVIDFSSSQGFSVSLSGDGRTALVGAPNQNTSMGGLWWFSANEMDGWFESGMWINPSPSLKADEMAHEVSDTTERKNERVGISVSLQVHGPYSVAGGYGVVCLFEFNKYVMSIRLPEWTGHPLSVSTNYLHVFVGCADLDKVWVFEWAVLLENQLSPTTTVPPVLQVLSCPHPGQLVKNNNSGVDSNAFGCAVSSTWKPHQVVVGAFKWNYLNGASFCFAWSKTDKKYMYSQLLSDTNSTEGSIQGQGSAVCISSENGSLVCVGGMLSGDSRGGVLQYAWDDESGKFVLIPKLLVPRNVGAGALCGSSVSCSGRGDSLVMGNCGDSDHGSVSVFQ